MKTMHSFYKYVLALILMMSGAQTLQAQDAFYIYRNDGNFDGFFYDEIVRMGYSKTDLEGEEHDVFVVQEIETKDSLFRIPLNAIDSIGFQQPEIRMNPKLKIISRCGLLPYIQRGGYLGADFYGVPDDMVPQVGDVLIGLPTDPNAEEIYEDGSFSCVVERVVRDDADSRQIYVVGHPVEQISDVFDQYITVEEIGVDAAGNVRRRVAGCDPNGIPRRIPQSDGVTLLNITGTLSHEWKPSDNTSVGLSADVGIKLKLRVAYEISWTRFFVKLSHDLIVKTKPSVSLSIGDDFEYNVGDLAPIKSIMFPAACPIFKTDPIPEIFLRGGGKLEAKLNLPAVELGFGDDIILDSHALFPVGYDMHMVPSDGTITDDMLDLSSSVSLSGFLQTGIKVSANLGTANWFKKVLMGDIGLFLYIGPKLEAEVSYSQDLINGPDDSGVLLNVLSNSNIRASLLSVDLEAKATAAAFWSEPQERTFFSKNWSFLNDTITFLPRLGATTVDINGDAITVGVDIKKGKVLGPWIKVYMGIYDATGVLVKQIEVGNGSGILSNDHYSTTISASELKGEYFDAQPLITWGSHGPYPYGENIRFKLPFYFDTDQTTVHFNAGNPADQDETIEQKLYFRTNCPKDRIFVDYSGFLKIVPGEDPLEVLDEKAGDYILHLKVSPNTELFERQQDLVIILGSDPANIIKLIQDAPDLSKLKSIGASAKFWVDDQHNYMSDDVEITNFTATRYGKTISIIGNGEHTVIDESGYKTTRIYELMFNIEGSTSTIILNHDDYMSISQGVFKTTKRDSHVDETWQTEENFFATFGGDKDINGRDMSMSGYWYFTIPLLTASYHYKHTNPENHEYDEEYTKTLPFGESSRIDIILNW